MRRLEIGPGDCQVSGDWDRLDAFPIPSVPLTYVAQWGNERLPIEDCAYDVIYASHVIEHIPWYRTIDALREAHRILSVGGTLEVWTVDFALVVQSYLDRCWTDGWNCDGRVKNYMQSVAGRIFSYERTGQWNWHKAVFDRGYLKACLYEAGFIATMDLVVTRGHDHGAINLGVAGLKL